MKIKPLIITVLVLFAGLQGYAQEEKELTLTDAIDLALKNSDQAKISETKVTTAEAELKSLKNTQYPDVSIGGQYQYISNPKINLKIPLGDGNNNDSPMPKVHQIMLGQAKVALPVFSGFKLKNTIKAGENNYQAAVYISKDEKEQLIIQTVHGYINLFKARKTVALLTENLKSSKQRVSDFTEMEKNGLLARNDLLKAQLQQANDELELEEAKKNEYILNYRLAITLKLPENTVLQTNGENFGTLQEETPSTEMVRNDLLALKYRKKAAENQIKAAKSAYYPSLSLVAGYIALDVQNVVSIQNAMNVGVGFSYNLADIFKAKSDIQAAESRAMNLQYTLDQVSDQVKVEIENAKQEYQLAIRKSNVYTQSEEQATENYRIVKDKYDNGLVDINDLLEANVDQLQAKINLAYAKANISEKYYELLTAEGTLINRFTNK